MNIDVGIDRAWEGGWLKVTGLTVKQQEDITILLEAYRKITGAKKQIELANPLNKISLYLKFLRSIPIKTATNKEL